MVKRPVVKKILFALLGLALSVLFMLPYLYWRNELRQYSALSYLGLAAACAISNMSVLLPSSSTVYVLLASTVLNPFLCILVGGLGTDIGEQTSYLCGLVYGKGTKGKVALREKAPAVAGGKVACLIQRNAFLTVFLFAFVPLPVFDAAGIGAGAAGMKWTKFAIAAFLGKTLKYALAVLCFFVVLPMIDRAVPTGVPLLHELLSAIDQLMMRDGASVLMP